MTTAFLVLRLYLSASSSIARAPFDRILDPVQEGRADAGLLIHEGQLTYEGHGLHKVVDLGEWWLLETGLRCRSASTRRATLLGKEALHELSSVLEKSIRAGLDNRTEALSYTSQFGRGLNAELTDRFVGMYVNELTCDYGGEGRSAVQGFCAAARRPAPFPSRFASTSSLDPASRPRGTVRTPSGVTAGNSQVWTTRLRLRSRPRSNAQVPTAEIEDVYFGCANQAGEDNRNVARMAALLAGLPESVAGVTVNRLCASGLSAVVAASHAVAAGDGDLFVAGGVESIMVRPWR